MGASSDWTAWGEALYKTHYVVAVDLPFHGAFQTQCEAVSFEGMDMEALTASLAQFIQKQRLNPCALMGYSMGGRVALQLALRFPSLLNRLVLISATAGLKTDAERVARRQSDAHLAAQLAAFEQATDPIGEMEAFLAKWYALPLFSSLADHPPLLARLIDQKKYNAPSALAASLAHFGTGEQAPLWDCLPDLSLPSLMLVGERDGKYTALGHEMAALSPHLALAVIPHAGHAVHVEAFNQAFAQIQAFLTDAV